MVFAVTEIHIQYVGVSPNVDIASAPIIIPGYDERRVVYTSAGSINEVVPI